MTWNYRILEHRNVDGGLWFAIHEVYYDEAGTPKLCSEEPCFAYGEDIESLATNAEYMMKALIKPILSYNDFDNKE